VQKTCSAEGRVELAVCYYREGLFDLARSTFHFALEDLSDEDRELRSIALIRLGAVERHAGRLHDALTQLDEAAEIVGLVGPWATGRHHLELATTLKELAISEMRYEYFDQAIDHYQHGLYEFESTGDHRNAATVENNYGFLLLTLNRLDEAEVHLRRARTLFEGLADRVKSAQVDDTVARLHISAGRFELAEKSIVRAVTTLEGGGEEALLAEALTTQGRVLCRLGRHREAKRVLDRANRVAESCGDNEGLAALY
jgi:tetratricopeptide (TPR) repeat protein